MTTTLIGHFGYRKIACLGSLVCSAALLTTSFATSLSSMYVTFGIVWGLGASFSFFSSLLVLRFYFNQKLARANGIAMTGSAAGTLLLNIAIGKLNESVGWRTSLRLLSALSAATSICGCTFLPPPDICPVAKQWAQYSKVSGLRNRANYSLRFMYGPSLRCQSFNTMLNNLSYNKTCLMLVNVKGRYNLYPTFRTVTS